jgi:Fe-S oxidoreductase
LERIQGRIEDCLQNEPAFCTAACPFHLDVRDFIGKMQRGSFNAAYRTYLNAVGFPGIVSTLCDEPCKNVCPRRITDGAISMRLLEKAALNYASRTDPNNYNLPSKNKKVAIIGAGISGLACALRLSAKNYAVTVYQREGRIGGQLWEQLPADVFLADIERQFQYVSYTLSLNTEITRLGDLNFDAIYVATGLGGSDFGLKPEAGGIFASSTPGLFLGGALMGGNSIQAMADGLHVAGAMERYIKTGSMHHPRETDQTRLELDPASIIPSEPVWPQTGAAYTQAEALREAKRCLKCACDACIRYCDLMRYFKKFPKRIDEEVEITIHPGTLDGNGTVATRFISTCNQCGLCREVCPKGIDMGDFLLKSHRTMREQGAMPWAFHDFFLQDMAFTNGAEAYLARRPQGYAESQHVFFPGCQLGASDPRYATESYRWLLGQWPDTALMLGCCGAPAEWAGDEAARAETIAKLKADWVALGKPTAIFACPTCRQMFKRHLPEIAGVFLYNLMAEQGISPPKAAGGETVSVFDPCASRDEPELQQAVRALAQQAGYILQPLPLEGKLAQCCSWGGQVSITNPRYAGEVVKARTTESDLPYITYCINCRDIFGAAKKPAYHLLDILFGLHPSDRQPPTVTERRSHRIALRRHVVSEFWKDGLKMEERKSRINLQIAPQLKQKLSDEMILETDIEAVVEHCETSGRKVLDPESGYFTGHLQVGTMTYWAEYFPIAGGCELVKAYGHRMRIEEA